MEHGTTTRHIVRRSPHGPGWRIVDRERLEFVGTFSNAVLRDVRLIGTVTPVPLTSRESSQGEIEGTFIKRHAALRRFNMPRDMRRRSVIVLDSSRDGYFHATDNPKRRIKRVDILVLRNDGTMIAGWRK